jgi:transporter family protein
VPGWLYYSLLVIALWGIVGLLQKLGTNRVSANSLLIWLMVGYVLLIPWLLSSTRLSDLTPRDTVIGTLAGITNGLGAWYLFASLESGAKASVAIPLTALNPLLTILLAMIFLSERLTALQWVGILMAIVAGVMISHENSRSTVGHEKRKADS